MTRASIGRLRTPLAIACLIGTLGCPIPVRHTEFVSANVTGIIREVDGTPAVGVPVAVTPSVDDVACATPSARGVTDSAGRFHLPAVSEQKDVYWFTPLEHFGATQYRFCARGLASATPQQDTAMTSTRMMGWMTGDTLDCIR